MNCRICNHATDPFLRISTNTLEPFLDAELRKCLPELDLRRCAECGCLWANDARQDDGVLAEAYERLAAGHISVFSRAGLRKLLESHGYEILAWNRCEHPSSPGPVAWWRVHLFEPLRRALGRNRSWYPFWRDHRMVVARLN